VPAINAASAIAEIDPKIFFMTPPSNGRFLGLSLIGRMRRPLGSVIANTFLRFGRPSFPLKSLKF